MGITMEHRLGRTLRVFLVALAAAGFYRLAVVPLVEPRVREQVSAHEMTPEEAAAIRARADRRLAALGDVFPAGSWERDNPIMLESRQMRLLFKDYHSLPDGRVNLVPCTLVVLPDRNRVAAETSGGRTMVLRAPQGAVLEFDEPLDLRQGRLAKLIGGSLRGQVTIRGTPSTPGADDDIEIVTRDVELDELEVQTNEMVQFRYGRSSGSGRGMMAKLTPREGAPQQAVAAKPGRSGRPVGDQGPNIGGVDSIRLDRDVKMRLEGVAGSFLPGREADAAPASAEGSAQASAQPPAPVLVSCRGSLCLNVSANVITLEDHVDVIRTTAESTTDHLACDLLAIMLARRDQQPGAAQGKRGSLEPVEIQAKGNPVVVTSDAAALEARAARLGYEIATRRILLDGEEPVALTVRDTEMEARRIDYCPGPPGDPGSLLAVGPGWLRGRAVNAPPMQVRWQQWLRMRPDGNGHVVSIAGDSEVVVERQGRLAATEMHLWLDMADAAVKQAKQAKPAGPPGPDFSRVRPSRLLARGIVEADADAATVRTDRLELWFKSQPAPQVAQAAPAQRATPAAAPALAPAQPQAPREERPQGKIVATGGLVRGLVTLGPAGNQIDELSMEGQVRLLEQPLAAAAAPEPPLDIQGDQLQVSRPQRFDARAIVSGRPARVSGRGLDLEGPLVEFDRGRSRLTVDGAGRLALPMGQAGGGLDVFGFSDAAGGPAPVAAAPAAAAQKLNVTWQGRMDFDGLTARFVEQVVASSDRANVHAGSLDVVFDKPFRLGADGLERGGPQPEVARIACGSGVRVESETQTPEGGRSKEQLFVKDLVIDRASGDVSGTGPGRLTSTRLGESPAAGFAPGGAAGLPARPAVQPVAATTSAPGLTYLGVDFQRGLRGNLNRRVMEFHQRVEAIWGPVAAWGDTLDPHAANGLPAGVFTVSCDVLGLGQSPPQPASKRPGIELAAGGNVLVEGESFTARSARLTWSEGKDLLVFEGDGRSDAQLFRQLQAGAQPSSASAGKILYWRGLNRVDVEDARFLDLDQLRGSGPAPAMPGAAGPAPRRPVPPKPQQSLPST